MHACTSACLLCMSLLPRCLLPLADYCTCTCACACCPAVRYGSVKKMLRAACDASGAAMVTAEVTLPVRCVVVCGVLLACVSHNWPAVCCTCSSNRLQASRCKGTHACQVCSSLWCVACCTVHSNLGLTSGSAPGVNWPAVCCTAATGCKPPGSKVQLHQRQQQKHSTRHTSGLLSAVLILCCRCRRCCCSPLLTSAAAAVVLRMLKRW
jgi:hypothetical protein